jgi:UDP-N-acetylmuramyl pentapeptide synthase
LAEHVAVIRSAASRGFAKVCFVGKEFMKASKEMGSPDGVLFFETSDALADWLRSYPLSGATILIKGSRGTRMEKTIPEL